MKRNFSVNFLLTLLITVLAVAVMGYHPGFEDDGIYLSAIKKRLNPALFPHDSDFFRFQMQATLFDNWIAGFVRWSHISLAWAELLWQMASIALILYGCWRIARRLFSEARAQWAGVAMVAAMLSLPVAGTGLYLVDQHLHPRTMATAFILLAVERVLARRKGQAALLLALAFALHPIMAALGLSFCIFLAMALLNENKDGTKNLLQNCLQFAMKRQGTTSVVPKTAFFESGYSRCGIANIRKQIYAGAKAQDLLVELAARLKSCLDDSRNLHGILQEAPRMNPTPTLATKTKASRGWGTRWQGSTIAVAFVPLGWVFAPPNPLWRQAVLMHNSLCLYHWAWYEWLGAVAPLGLFWLLSRFARRQGDRLLQRFALAVAAYGAFQLALAMTLLAIPSLIRVAPFQPMRFLHLIYFFLTLMAGCLLGRYLLKARLWRWAVYLAAINGGMFLSQWMLFDDSYHLELPGRAAANPWLQAFGWVRQKTPVDAYFALDPEYMAAPGEDYHCFRALAERGMMADNIKDPAVVTQIPELASQWARDVKARQGWKSFQRADFERLKAEFGVDWVVVAFPQPPGLACEYHNNSLSVCRIP